MTRTGVKELQPCGTEAAFRRHHRRRERPCTRCRQAHAAYEREGYQRRTVRAA